MELGSMETELLEKRSQRGCWVAVRSLVSGLWSTGDLVIGSDSRVQWVKTSFREMTVYLAFLAVLAIVTLSAMSPVNHDYTVMVSKLFRSQPRVSQVHQLWDFLEGELLDGLYVEEWYNSAASPACPTFNDTANDLTNELTNDLNDVELEGGGKCRIAVGNRLVLHANKLLGVPRLRQLRVKNDSCSVPHMLSDAIDLCFADYAMDNEDKEDFGPDHITHSHSDAWRYQSGRSLGGHVHWGLHGLYSGGGSIQNLRSSKGESARIIRELREALWISRATRYVVVDFTLYNANLNLFCVVKLNFEFVSSGGIVPTAKFGTVKLLRYNTRFDYVVMGIYTVVFALFLVYYFIEEMLEIKQWGLVAYFSRFWSLIDVFVLIVSTCTLGYNAYLFSTVSERLRALLSEPEVFLDFSLLESWATTFRNFAAVTVFLGLIKIFKFIAFNATMTQLALTLQRAARDVLTFSVLFTVVFMAYAQFGYRFFGVHLDDFSTLQNACFTQFRLILGDFDFVGLVKSDRLVGPLYFLSFVLVVYFVLMNMFLAIINDTYSVVKTEVEGRRQHFHVADLVYSFFNNARQFFYNGNRDKLRDVRNAVKLADDNIEDFDNDKANDLNVDFAEIRKQLHKFDFSDLEIEIFCSQYDVNGDLRFDVDELNAFAHHSNAANLTNDSNNTNTNRTRLTRKQVEKLQRKLRRLESRMSGTLAKMNAVVFNIDVQNHDENSI